MHIFLLLIVCLGTTCAWDGDELEVFDVVEEVNQNFYNLLGVPREADGAAIKKAFRKLSLILHPDKNNAPDADIQFRQLVSVYDILKDPNKRNCYNNVLDNGLPDWKQAVYYYRRVRKMGLREMFFILFVIISIGQYLYGWASYVEKKLTVDEYLNAKTKKSLKKQKKGKQDTTHDYLLEEMESVLVKPSLKNTLPCQIPCMIWWLVVCGPPLLYHSVNEYWHERQLRKQQLLQQQEESKEEVGVAQRAPRKRKTLVLPELKDDGISPIVNVPSQTKTAAPPVISGGLWTDDDLLELAKLVKKFPVGTIERWDKIGSAMNRPASEVAHMAHKLKDDVLKNLAQKGSKDNDGDNSNDSGEENEIVEEPKKVKTRGGKIGDEGENNEGSWSQIQQRALENALTKFSKGSAIDRWLKIAKYVPGKTKEECMLRYKYLVGMLKKKKEKDEDGGISSSDQDGCNNTDPEVQTETINENASSIT